jgi:uncharacterized protein (TIGR02996 family)
MTLEKAFLQDIGEHPDDDAPRLIYADWLEENGEEAERARAHFIQFQIERIALPADSPRHRELLFAEAPLRNRYGKLWWHTLPKLRGVTFQVFERGFVPGAHLGAYHQLGEPLDPLFEAAPIQRLFLHNLGETKWADVLQSRYLTRLTHLECRSVDPVETCLLAIANCPHLDSLRSLVVTAGTGWSDRAIGALAASPSLLSLTRLELGGSLFPTRLQQILRDRFGKALVTPFRPA